MKDLNGKWALVTGASRGIGAETALALAKQGCNLLLHSRRTESLACVQEKAEALGVQVKCYAADFSVPGAADALLEAIAPDGVSVDILVNNAAVNLSVDRELANLSNAYFDWPEAEHLRTMQVNVVVPSVLACRVLPGMLTRGFGRIVTMTSSIRGATDHLAYSVSKAAVDKLTADLSAAVHGEDVAVSAVDPGWCQTYLGGEGATCAVADTQPGMLVPICMDIGANGRIFRAQAYAGMTLEEALKKAEEQQ